MNPELDKTLVERLRKRAIEIKYSCIDPEACSAHLLEEAAQRILELERDYNLLLKRVYADQQRTN